MSFSPSVGLSVGMTVSHYQPTYTIHSSSDRSQMCIASTNRGRHEWAVRMLDRRLFCFSLDSAIISWSQFFQNRLDRHKHRCAQ